MNAKKIDSRVGSLITKFRRRGGKGQYTMPFDELEPSTQHDLLKKIQTDSQEKPVIGCFLNGSEWLLITTERTAWYTEGSLSQLFHGDLKGIDWLYSSKTYGSDKKNWKSLKLLSATQGEMIVPVEPGNSVTALWNVFQLLYRMYPKWKNSAA